MSHGLINLSTHTQFLVKFKTGRDRGWSGKVRFGDVRGLGVWVLIWFLPCLLCRGRKNMRDGGIEKRLLVVFK